MCHRGTIRSASWIWAWLAFAAALAAQDRLDWRRVGNGAIDLALPSVATGPVDAVWFSPDGRHLFVSTASGRVWETENLEDWGASQASRPAFARLRTGPGATPVVAAGRRQYAFGAHVWSSEDGRGWANITQFRGRSILGSAVRDLAVSPRDPDEIVAVTGEGVWRSVDAGVSWTGLNEGLPNLPARRILALPDGPEGVKVELETGIAEWAPGERGAWRRVNASDGLWAGLQREALRRSALRATIAVDAGRFVYASSPGRLTASSDGGATWMDWPLAANVTVSGFHVDPADPAFALAAAGTRLLRTLNGGLFWDDVTANLPAGATVRAVAADRDAGAIYAGTDSGLFTAVSNLRAAGEPAPWTRISTGLPEAKIFDVKLDASGHQIYVMAEGFGVYAAMAPHRLRELRLVNGADLSARAAAPGSLLSVLGGRVRSARAGDRQLPVLDGAGHVQVPFDAQGPALTVALEAQDRRANLTVPLRSVSPAVFVESDGSPLALDADSGILLDAMTPARSGRRIQILATGLGRVNPEWPTGVAAPLNDPPKVAAEVRVYLDRTPVEVMRATLAPGYIGFYVIEVVMPLAVNEGPAELYVEAGGQQSNRVRIYTSR